MGYVLSNEVRLYTGLTQDDISNDDLDDLIDVATEFVVKDLTLAIKDEEATGDIDGSNTTFSVCHYPIADTSGNKTVGSEDITVYSWTDEDDPSTKSSISVSTVYSRDGKIVVTSAPSASIEKVTVDYNYTMEEDINWELVKLATSYVTAYIFAIKKFTILPESVSRGPIRWRFFSKPYDQYLNKYYEIMDRVRKKKIYKKTNSDITLDRERM